MNDEHDADDDDANDSRHDLGDCKLLQRRMVIMMSGDNNNDDVLILGMRM